MAGAHGEDEATEGMATLIAEQYWRPVAACRSAGELEEQHIQDLFAWGYFE